MKRFALSAVATLGLLGATHAFAAEVDPVLFKKAQAQLVAAIEANPDLDHNPVAILVKFRPEASEQGRETAMRLIGGKPIAQWDVVPGVQMVYVTTPPSVAVNMLNMGVVPDVEYAEPDFIVHADVIPNDPNLNLCWGLHNTGQTVNGDPGIADADIDAPEAWDVFTGDPNFVVAVIDTGIQLNHPDLAANIWVNTGEIPGNGIDDDGNGRIDDINGWDFYANDNNPSDENGHGTHCAGTIGAVGNNGIGVVGVNWRCKIAALRFLGPSGSGSISGALSAVNYCTTKGIKVSNNSWGGGGFSSSFQTAITNAGNIGHVFVAAAGNSNNNNDSAPSYPASYTNANVIAVAATDNNDLRASFSSYGATSVDVGAPGVNVRSTYPTSSYAYLSGTSMATPHVSGLVTLVYARNPGWTHAQVKAQILNTVRPIAALQGLCVTGGVINAAAALGGSGGNSAPIASITAPANNSTFTTGVPITFTGTATDAQDGNVSGSLVWTSSINGQIGTGASFSTSGLSSGVHSITARATDSGGLQGSAGITITVNGPPAAPSSCVARQLVPLLAEVTWVDNSGTETSFEIQREQLINAVWTNTTTVGSVGANIRRYNEYVPASGRYRYRVRAMNASGGSAYSNWSAVTL